jgi:hypothetical protein
MTLRLVFGMGWSMVTGMTGLWLTVAPWALGEQGGGDWTTVTKGELSAGVGLMALGVVGIVVVVAQVVGSLRESDANAPAHGRARAGGGGVASSPDMERALIELAMALAEDLDAQRAPASDGRPEQGVTAVRETR